MAALLLNLLGVVAQIGTPRETATDAIGSESGVITGRVVNENGQPLPNARVSIRAATSSAEGRTVFTDRDGRFEITKLGPAAYEVSASLAAYTPLLQNDDSAGPTYYRDGDSVTLVLVKGGVITGTVTSQGGEPVVGVPVRAKLLNRKGRRPYAQFAAEAKTDDRGVYRLYGLAGGTYIVWAGGGGVDRSALDPFDWDVPTYSPSSSSDTAARIDVSVGQETSNVDISYRGGPGRTISGRSIPDGFGIIFLSSADEGESRWEKIAHIEAGPEGFSFFGLDDGDYDLTAHVMVGKDMSLSEPRRIEVRGADVTGVELIPKPLGWISGRVVLRESAKSKCADRRRPVFAETLVFAKPKEKSKSHSRFIPSPGFVSAADSQGHIALKHLVSGQYYFDVQFEAKSWYLGSVNYAPATIGGKTQPDKPSDASKVWTRIKPGDRLTGLTLTLAEGAASFHGHIALTGEETLPEDLTVVLVPVEAENADAALRYYLAAIARDGKITMKNLAPGRYWMLAQSGLDEVQSGKLRLPDEAGARRALRREAEAAGVEVEFKPCENVVEFPVPLKRPAL